jgi:hypothetical protein
MDFIVLEVFAGDLGAGFDWMSRREEGQAIRLKLPFELTVLVSPEVCPAT